VVPSRAFNPYLEQVRHRGRFCFFQIERVKTLSEPPVNRSQQFASLLRLALKAHAVTVTSCTLNSWQSVSPRWVLDRRTSGSGVAPTTDWWQFYPDYRATVLSLCPRYRQPVTAAVVTVIEVGNALKADIERPGLKCREGP